MLRLAFKFGGLVFPTEGEYRFILEADGSFLIERRVVAVRREEQ